MPADLAPQGRPALEFETPRLRGRWLTDQDERFFRELYGDPVTMRFIGQPLSSDGAARAFARVLPDMRDGAPDRFFLTLVETELERLIGIMTVRRIDLPNGAAEAGIVLHPEFVGRGYGREAMAAVIDRTFATLAVDRIGVAISAGNMAAERVAQVLGFGDPEERPRKGELRVRQCWLRRDEWNARSAAPTRPARQRAGQ